MLRPTLFSLATCCAALLCAAPAHAVERQHHLGLAPVAGLLKAREHGTQLGVGAAALYHYGLSDQFNLHLELTHQQFLVPQAAEEAPRNRPAFASSAAVGVSYVLDVLRWVPYAGVFLSGNALGGGERDKLLWLPGAELAVGLDYQFSRHLVGGVLYRQRVYFTQLNELPLSASLGLKLEWQWGF